MNDSVKNVVDHFAKRIFDIQFAEVHVNAKKKAVDIDCRIVSDFISCENEFCSHATPHILGNCKWWSEAAIEKFNSLGGTKRQRREAYESGKRVFNIEHQFPLGIIKEKVVNQAFETVEQVKDYLIRYNKVVIVTSEENDKLNATHKTATTIPEARKRYKHYGIVVKRFDMNCADEQSALEMSEKKKIHSELQMKIFLEMKPATLEDFFN